MKRRAFLLEGMAATAALTLAACDNQSKKPAPQARQRITVAQWGQERYLIYLPFYIAQSKGLFTKQNLDVSLTFSGNDDQVFASVARGDAQFGIGDPIFAAISRNRGGDGVVIGQLVSRVALWGIAKQGAPLRTKPQDFAGARVGTFPRPSTNYTLMRDMIDQHHIPDCQIVEVPVGSEIALLESGAADVVMMLEPAASLSVSKGYQIVTSFPTLWGDFAFTGLTSTQSFASKNAGTVKAMRSALQEALDIAHHTPEQATAIARSLFPSLSATVVEQAVSRMLKDMTLPTQFAASLAGWKAVVRVRQEMGQLKPGDYQSTLLD